MSSDDRNALFCIVGLIAVIVIAVVLFLTTSPIKVMVDGHHWQREIQIEDFQPRRHTDWDESVPGDAYNRTCWTEQRSSRRVRTGETCTGSGENRSCRSTYTSVPIYDTKCSYTVDRWGYERSLFTSGQSVNETPIWPTVSIHNCSAQTEWGCERTSNYIENYWVHFTNKDYQFECGFVQAVWQDYHIESFWNLEMGTFIHIPRCETLKETQP